jgi:phenylacetate-CoA ligase
MDNYKEICRMMEDPLSAESEKAHEFHLQGILSHAVESASFYSHLKGFRSLSKFPIINKSIIRSDFDKFISNHFNRARLTAVVTSGSTGTPFKVLHNTAKVRRNSADTIYFSQLAGFELGQPLHYLKIWNSINKKNRVVSWIQNVKPHNVLDLSDRYLRRFFNNLQRVKSPKALIGYASAFQALCGYLNGAEDMREFNVSSIICISEALDPFLRDCLRLHFKSNVVSRYSNIENGILAQQAVESDFFRVNTASYHVEILHVDGDFPVKQGEPGRLVVTDLFNYGMPIVRYDTGDIAISAGLSGSSGVVLLSSIEGRKMDAIYDTKGNHISSFIVTNSMWKYSELLQYQFIQIASAEYVFKLNTSCEFRRERELIREFKLYLGEDASISIQYVDDIPLLQSGKRKKVVNLWAMQSKSS